MKTLNCLLILSVLVFGFDGCYTSLSQSPQIYTDKNLKITQSPLEPEYQVETIKDKFDGYTIFRLLGKPLKPIDSTDYRYREITLLPVKIVHKNDSISLYLVASYISSDWLFIPQGESLVLLIDNERTGLSGEGSMNYRRVSGRVVKEQSNYSVDKNILIKLGNAKTIELKLIGAQESVLRKFSPFDIDNIKRFVNELCK